MTPEAQQALQCETDFLAGVEANFETAKGRHFRGTIWQTSRQHEEERVRALMASNRLFDRELLKSLPANRRIILQGFEKRFLFGKRKTGVAIAAMASPLSHYIAQAPGSAPPIGLGELADHVRKLVMDARVPHVIGVCSPSGFTEEAKKTRLDQPNVTVLLIEPDGGGWRVLSTGDSVDPRLLQIFDPEGTNQKLERVRRYVEENSTDLLTGGLSVSAASGKLGLPDKLVQQGFERVATSEPELRVTRKDGEFLLFRGAAAPLEAKRSMNVIERIRQLFSGEADSTQRINLLAERRAALAQRRDRMYEDIGKLETKEADLLAQGKAATSQVPRRRLAAQLAQMRKDIARQNTTAAMLNQQINIISTDIHNLTLIQQGEMAQLPDTEQLTENAVRAEELLESLKANSELVGSLGMGMEATLTNEEELAILREFEAGDGKAAAALPKKTSADRPTTSAAWDAEVEEPPSRGSSDKNRKKDAEPT